MLPALLIGVAVFLMLLVVRQIVLTVYWFGVFLVSAFVFLMIDGPYVMLRRGVLFALLIVSSALVRRYLF